MARSLPIAVIGAGFSGTMAALQLLSALPRHVPVLLCERGGRFARGLAYATSDPAHLLNLRTANMSAYPDEPKHFENWLARSVPEPSGVVVQTQAGAFAARGLYGAYLAELLTEAVTGGGPPRLQLVNDAVIDLEPSADGFRLRTEGGQTHAVAGAVLAVGNLTSDGEPRSRHRRDPWAAESFDRLHPHRPVLIVGSGLTMVDTVSSLRGRGFTGPVVALSRRGLLPHAHAATKAWPTPDLKAADLRSLSGLLARLRQEAAAARAQDVGWHDVVDALRPITDTIWRSLPSTEQERFLRHLRPFWDIHRHRAAPPAAETVVAEIARGSLAVRAGRLLAIEDQPSEAIVTWRPRGGAQDERLTVQCILDATGIGRFADTTDPLLRRLMARGLVRPGPFGLGLDAGDDFRVRGDVPSRRLWALGPLLRGVLWECIAVPDIRNAAAHLATALVAEFDRSEAA